MRPGRQRSPAAMGRLVYVAVAQASKAAATGRASPPGAGGVPHLRVRDTATVQQRAATVAPRPSQAPPDSVAPNVAVVAPAREAYSSRGTEPVAPTPAASGAPRAGAIAGIVDDRRRRVRYDSLLEDMERDLAGRFANRGARPAQTQGERDVELRAEALERAAARAAGRPSPMARLGGGISVPLPFGGPSRKQRERERALNAQGLEILRRLQRRADSVEAVRRQKRADSLALPRDTLVAPRPR